MEDSYKIKTYSTKDVSNIPPNAVVFRLNKRTMKNRDTFFMWFCFIKGKVYGDFVVNSESMSKREEVSTIDVMVRQMHDTMISVYKLEQQIESRWLHKRILFWFKDWYYRVTNALLEFKWGIENKYFKKPSKK